MNPHPQVRWVLWQATPQGFVVRCNVCGQSASAGDPTGVHAFARDHAQHESQSPTHYGAGDAVAAVTKRLGIEPCTPCEARRRALNGMFPNLWRRR